MFSFITNNFRSCSLFRLFAVHLSLFAIICFKGFRLLCIVLNYCCLAVHWIHQLFDILLIVDRLRNSSKVIFANNPSSCVFCPALLNVHYDYSLNIYFYGFCWWTRTYKFHKKMETFEIKYKTKSFIYSTKVGIN